MFGKSLNLINKLNINNFQKTISKGYKMTQLHMYQGAGAGAPSGIKVCIFGATSNIANKISAMLAMKGTPLVFAHRNVLDVICPQGDDIVYTRSNPYHSFPEFVFHYDVVPEYLFESKIWTELGNRYYQYCADLTNEFDIENAIKECDVVINCIGQKPVIRNDEDYEEPNIIIPREIAKVAQRMKKEGKVKRLIHFSAAGCGPDAISRRLRTKWQGEQEVLKYFPEATIIRPTNMVSYSNHNNFLG